MYHPRTPALTTTSARPRRRAAALSSRALLVALAFIGPLALATQTASATPAAVTETATNSVVSVAFGLGWNVASSSTSTSLLLLGPDGLSALFFTSTVSGSESLSGALQSDLADRQKLAPNARVCSAPKSQKLPGSPAVLGDGELICFSLESAKGAAVSYEDLVVVALVKGNGGKLKLETDGTFPGGTSTTTVEDSLIPVVFSAKWEQLKS